MNRSIINDATENKLCPSANCTSESKLLGIVMGEQEVAILPEPIPLTTAFIEEANKDGEAEKNYRFVAKCSKSGCKQWTGSSCGIMNALADANPHISADESELIECAIRPACRWFSQDGPRACVVCPFVVTTDSKRQSMYDV